MSMPSRRQSGSWQSAATLRTWASAGLRWSVRIAWSALLSLSLLTISGCGGDSDSGSEPVEGIQRTRPVEAP